MDPGSALYFPTGQSAHDDACTYEDLPLGHNEQVTAPTVLVYDPSEQEKHPPNPEIGLCSPIGQSVHNDVRSLENLPAGQIAHFVAPVVFEYVPPMQSMHVVDLVSVVYCPTEQGVHDVAPYEEKDVPAGQGEHFRAPTVFEYAAKFANGRPKVFVIFSEGAISA